MGPLESRNDFAMVFFRKDFHPRRKLHPQIFTLKNLALDARCQAAPDACKSKTPPTKGSQNRLVLSI